MKSTTETATGLTRRRAAMHVLHVARRLGRHLEEALDAELGIFLSDLQVLAAIVEPQRMSDISTHLALSPGGVTKVIGRLEVLGYAQRTPDPDDGRATLAATTPEGRQALDRARAVIDEALDETWADRVSESEAEMVIELMSRIGE